MKKIYVILLLLIGLSTAYGQGTSADQPNSAKVKFTCVSGEKISAESCLNCGKYDVHYACGLQVWRGNKFRLLQQTLDVTVRGRFYTVRSNVDGIEERFTLQETGMTRENLESFLAGCMCGSASGDTGVDSDTRISLTNVVGGNLNYEVVDVLTNNVISTGLVALPQETNTENRNFAVSNDTLYYERWDVVANAILTTHFVELPPGSVSTVTTITGPESIGFNHNASDVDYVFSIDTTTSGVLKFTLGGTEYSVPIQDTSANRIANYFTRNDSLFTKWIRPTGTSFDQFIDKEQVVVDHCRDTFIVVANSFLIGSAVDQSTGVLTFADFSKQDTTAADFIVVDRLGLDTVVVSRCGWFDLPAGHTYTAGEWHFLHSGGNIETTQDTCRHQSLFSVNPDGQRAWIDGDFTTFGLGCGSAQVEDLNGMFSLANEGGTIAIQNAVQNQDLTITGTITEDLSFNGQGSFNVNSTGLIGLNAPTIQIDATNTIQLDGELIQLENANTPSFPAMLQFWEAKDNGTDKVAIRAPTDLTETNVYVWPALDGTDGQAMVTDGNGVLSFSSPIAEGVADADGDTRIETIEGLGGDSDTIKYYLNGLLYKTEVAGKETNTNIIDPPVFAYTPTDTLGVINGHAVQKGWTVLDDNSDMWKHNGSYWEEIGGAVDPSFPVDTSGFSQLIIPDISINATGDTITVKEKAAAQSVNVDASASDFIYAFSESNLTDGIDIIYFTNTDVSNEAKAGAFAGQTLSGVDTFYFSNYSSGTQFRADEVVGGWVVSATGASTEVDKLVGYIEGARVDYNPTDDDNDFENFDLNLLVAETGTGWGVDPANNILPAGWSIDASGAILAPAGTWTIDYILDHPSIDASSATGVQEDVGNGQARMLLGEFINITTQVGQEFTEGWAIEGGVRRQMGIRNTVTFVEPTQIHLGTRTATNGLANESYAVRVSIYDATPTEVVLAGMVTPTEIATGEVELSSNQNFTASYSQVSGMELTLPRAGKYMLMAQVSTNYDNLASPNYARLYDNTAATEVLGTEITLGDTDVGAGNWQGSHPILKVYTTTVDNTVIHLQAKGSTVGANNIFSGSQGNTTISFVELPSSSVVMPDALDVEDNQDILFAKTSMADDASTVLDNGVTWQQVKDMYETVKFYLYYPIDDYHYSGQLRTEALVATGNDMSISTGSSSNAWIQGLDLIDGEFVMNSTASATYEVTIVGIKKQKTVINTTDAAYSYTEGVNYSLTEIGDRMRVSFEVASVSDDNEVVTIPYTFSSVPNDWDVISVHLKNDANKSGSASYQTGTLTTNSMVVNRINTIDPADNPFFIITVEGPK